MTTRAERRRELRDAGYRRAATKGGRRGSNRVPTLDPTAVARATAFAAIADMVKPTIEQEVADARSRRILLPEDMAAGERRESGLIVPGKKA